MPRLADHRRGTHTEASVIDRDPAEGDIVVARRTFTAEDFTAFAELSGDRNPLHHDAQYAAGTPVGVPIVPALLAAGPFSAAAGMTLPGCRSLILGVDLRALEPIMFDEEVTYSFRVAAASAATRTLEVSVLALQRGRPVLEGRLRVRVRDDVAPAEGAADAWGTLIPADAPRRALVTGAGGAIGAACARALAARGWQLTLQHRPDDPQAAALGDELGASAAVRFLPGDLAHPKDRTAVAAALAHTPLSAIIHAASPALVAPASTLLEVNYTALRALVEGGLGGMLERQKGIVVMIGSEAIRTRPVGWDDYVAAKCAAATYAETIARRHGNHGLRGVVVHPSFVAGDYSAAHRPDDAAALLPEEVAEVVAGVVAGEQLDAELWIRPGIVESGPVRDGLASPTAPVSSSGAPGADLGAPANTDPAASTNDAGTLGGDIERLAREVLRLDASDDLTGAALGRTKNWTSLAQIELVLALEREFSIAFVSSDLSATPSLADLKALVAEKIRS